MSLDAFLLAINIKDIAGLVIQALVAFGTLLLAKKAYDEMRANRKARELEIFEKYDKDYQQLKENAHERIQLFLNYLIGDYTSGVSAGHEIKTAIKNLLYLLLLFERQFLLKKKGWVSKDIWALWDRNFNRLIDRMIEVCNSNHKMNEIFLEKNFTEKNSFHTCELDPSFLEFMQNKLNNRLKKNA